MTDRHFAHLTLRLRTPPVRGLGVRRDRMEPLTATWKGAIVRALHRHTEKGPTMSKVEAGRPKVVPHFTPAERAARGKAARAEVPRTLQAEIEIPGDRDPVALLEEQAVTRVPELVPIRYGRMLASAVRLLPRRRADHGDGSLADAELGHPHPAVRRRAPLELRHVRLAGADPRLRHQRLRRDGAGAVGVGREAPGGELRDRGPRQRLLAEGTGSGRAGHGPLVPGGDDRLRRDAQSPGLVREPPDGAGAARVHGRSRPEAAEEGRGRPRQGAHDATACTPTRS